MKAWKESASLLLAARRGQLNTSTSPPSLCDYELLCLKRHQKSNFMPGHDVFPGGKVHASDADLKWHKLFSEFGFDKNSFSALLPTTTSRPDIFSSGPGELPKEISLRITAIRETFEECGVLICRHGKDSNEQHWSTHLNIPDSEMQDWQKNVHNDATEFYRMCEELKCYPDLWSLHEWSNWMSPTTYTGSRFNTAFFLACMPFMPHAKYEAKEMEDLKWDSPRNFLLPSTKVKLPPPQHYELARLAKFESIENLLGFAVKRSKIGVWLNIPVEIQLQDGRVYVLPGDSMYPEDVSLSERQVIDRTNMTVSALRDISPVKNRFEHLNSKAKILLVENYVGADGHVQPIKSETLNAPLH